jgi:hypothetical protein
MLPLIAVTALSDIAVVLEGSVLGAEVGAEVVLASQPVTL